MLGREVRLFPLEALSLAPRKGMPINLSCRELVLVQKAECYKV